nr:hypothetical protein CFP56_78861 [Quercus suber]
MVKVDHSACLALGGTFDPCYMLTLTSVPSQSGPLSNRRNAAAIQSFMADILSVPADRGIIKFDTVVENNIATNGNTLAGQNELMEKQNHEGTQIAMKRAITSASRKSVPSFKHSAGRVDAHDQVPNGQSVTPLAQKRKSMGATSQSRELFEIPAGFERPSTSHGQSTGHNTFDGLRMNGISREDLVGKNARLPNGRPKTIAAQPDVPRTASVPKSVQRNVSNRASQPVGAPAARSAAANRLALPNSFKPEQKSLSHVAALTKSEARANRPRDSYMDSESVSRDSSLRRNQDRPDYKLDARAAEKYANSNAETSSILSGKDTTANIAKRRSTITATPKMPAPPPIPETKTKEPKVGKRKSFLAALRRSTVGV